MVIMIAILPSIRDIERYLDMILGGDTAPRALGHDLGYQIMRLIPKKFPKWK